MSRSHAVREQADENAHRSRRELALGYRNYAFPQEHVWARSLILHREAHAEYTDAEMRLVNYCLKIDDSNALFA